MIVLYLLDSAVEIICADSFDICFYYCYCR